MVQERERREILQINVSSNIYIKYVSPAYTNSMYSTYYLNAIHIMIPSVFFRSFPFLCYAVLCYACLAVAKNFFISQN